MYHTAAQYYELLLVNRAFNEKQFGSKVSVCRQNKNMTQEEMAGRLGITAQALSKWERGISLPDIAMVADISRLLGVSTDYLLGVETPAVTEKKEGKVHFEVEDNLRLAMGPLELCFGKDLLDTFVENDRYLDIVAEVRAKLSREGILMPIVWIRDNFQLDEREFMILSYQNVLYSETLEIIDENTMEYMFRKLEECVQSKYYEIINPDIIRELVENLKIKYPALIEGVVPEKIPYSLLTNVAKKVMCRGDSILFLPKMIEVMDCALWNTPDICADELVKLIAQEIEREDNFSVVMHSRNAEKARS